MYNGFQATKPYLDVPILELVWRKEKTSLLLGKDCETCLCHVHFLHLYK